MKKLLIILYLLVSPILVFAGDPSDFGWSFDLESFWSTMRTTNNSAYTVFKTKVDNGTIKSQWDYNAGADLMWRITEDTTYVAKEWDVWDGLCGMNPFEATASSSTDRFTRTNAKLVMSTNAPIKFQGTMPSPLVANTTYYARDISGNTFKVSASSGGSAIDLTTTGSGITYTFNDGVYYRPAGCTIQTYNYLRLAYPSMIRSYAAIRDNLSATDRANFRDILDYVSYRIMEYANFSEWSGSLTVQSRTGDTDETSIKNIGLWAYALVTADETPKTYQLTPAQIYASEYGENSERPLGSLTSTGSNSLSWRNLLRSRFEDFCNGGVWIEGSEYNVYTIRILLEFVEHIRDYSGSSLFPELTDDCYTQAAKAFINQLSPTLSDLAQWSDNNDVHVIRHINWIGTMSALAYLANRHNVDSSLVSTLRYLTDTYDTAFGTSTHRQTYFDDRSSTPRTNQMSGNSIQNSADRGTTFYHKNWGGADDTLVALYNFNIGEEHDLESLRTFQLYSSSAGAWVLDNARGYPQSHDCTTYNTALIHGGVNCNGAGCDEARGQVAYSGGTDYLYVVGNEGGHQDLCGQQNPPQEAMHEHTSTMLYLSHADGSDSLLIHDRIDANNPTTLARLANYKGNGNEGSVSGKLAMMQTESYKHNWHMRVPNVSVTQTGSGSGALFSWPAGSETAYLKTFMSGYTYQLLTECKYGTSGCGNRGYVTGDKIALMGAQGGGSGDLKKQIRLVDNDTSTQWRTWLNLLHIGSTITTATILHNPASGDALDALYLEIGSEKYLAVFNATQGESIPESPSAADGSITHDSEKGQKIYLKSQFNTSLEVRPSTNAALTLYVANLNPNKTWRMVADGITTNDIDVDSSGLFIASIPASASNHVIVIDSTSTCSATDWRGCGNETICESNGWYWYNNICNQTPEADTTCSFANFTYCLTQSTCEAVGRFWYNSTCNADPQAPSCSFIDYTYCLTQGTCEAVGRYWYNSQCNATPQAVTCSYADYTYCTNQTDCENVGRFWYSGVCNASPQACSSSSCSTCLTQSTCESASCYWYNNTCNTTAPQPATDVTVHLPPQDDVYIRGGANANTNYQLGTAGVAAYDNKTTSSGTSISTLSFSHTPVSTPSLVVACVATEETTTHAISSITYGGSAMTLLGSQSNNGDDNMIWAYYKTSPSAGAQTFSLTMDSTIDYLAAGVMTFTGAAAPEAYDGDASTTNSAVVTSNITTLTADAILASCSNSNRNDAGINPQNSETERWDFAIGTHPNGFRFEGATKQATSVGAYTMGSQLNFGKTSILGMSIPPTAGTTADLEIMDATSDDNDRVILLRYDLADIPQDSIIKDVKMHFTIKTIQTTGKYNYVYKLLRTNWEELQATWNIWSTGNSWTAVGARGSGTDYTGDWTVPSGYLAYHAHQGVNPSDRITYTSETGLTTYIQDNIGNVVTFVIHQKASDNDLVTYYSSSNGDTTTHPELEITYSPVSQSGETPVTRMFGGCTMYGISRSP